MAEYGREQRRLLNKFPKIFQPFSSHGKVEIFHDITMLDNRPQAIQQNKLLNAIQSTPIQRAAVLVITEESFGDSKRKKQMKDATMAVSSKKPKKFFIVDNKEKAPRTINRVCKIADGIIRNNDNIDIFGHSLLGMPGGVSHDTLTAKINEKFDIPPTWAGSIRIFSCYGADGVGQDKYNVSLAKTFSATHTGLKGAGGSTKMMNLSPSKAGIYPISEAYTSVRNLVGIEALYKIKEKITPLLPPMHPKLIEIDEDIKNFARMRPSKVTEWKVFYYNLPNPGVGWEVATPIDGSDEWISSPTSLIGLGPGQVPSIKPAK